MKRSAATLAAILCLTVGPAHADDLDATPNIAGLWTFEAEVHPICSFSGQARLMPGDTPDTYGCELTARQDCPSVDVLYTVEQSCTATVEDDVLSVQSTIVNFLEGEPSEAYLPDHFQLVIKDASTMDGILIGSGAYPAIWRRAEGAIS
ncbi:hypothetical protein WNY37_07820 [Henriciella sp. AS95]|uniref:hypothetical protein n=1 Tax=Henriciella sp. AS95 TaxID=3135782 RepID=UPI003173BAC3